MRHKVRDKVGESERTGKPQQADRRNSRQCSSRMILAPAVSRLTLAHLHGPYTGRQRQERQETAAALFVLGYLTPKCGYVWGDQGHEIVVLVAQLFLVLSQIPIP